MDAEDMAAFVSILRTNLISLMPDKKVRVELSVLVPYNIHLVVICDNYQNLEPFVHKSTAFRCCCQQTKKAIIRKKNDAIYRYPSPGFLSFLSSDEF